jgi:SAM-dependent methyltransferase
MKGSAGKPVETGGDAEVALRPLRGAWYRPIHDLFERPWVFNLYQTLVDGGKHRQIRRFLADVPYRSVLDIGCGTGNWASTARGPYLGVDLSPSFIAACHARYRGDASKQFLQADVASLDLAERYDLAQLISVLHHLSDEEVRRLLDGVARAARFFFVLDLYPIPWNPVSRFLYAMDRGDHIRPPAAQKRLILAHPAFRLVKEGAYVAPTGLYRHTLFLFACGAGAG